MDAMKDLHYIKPDVIFTEAIGAIQEMHKQIQTLQNVVLDLQSQLLSLKIFIYNRLY
jgi:hypothetical protein